MRSFRTSWIVAAVLVVAGLVGWQACVLVDETQYVIVTSFGRPVAVHGVQPGDAGLHAKWPWQSALAIDRRVQVSEPPAREVITGDKKNLEVSSFVVWRVSDPMRFLRSAGTLDAAQARLEERVTGALSTSIGRHALDDLISTDPARWRLDDLTASVRSEVAPLAERELGIEVVEVGLRRFNYPLEVRPAVFDLIRSERQQVAAKARADGEAQYRTITSQADRDREAVLAKADAEAERILGEGDAAATRVLNAAHARDPEFAAFLRTLESYRAVLDERATVVLSASSPLLKLLTRGPSEELLKPPATGEKAASPVSAAASAGTREP